MEQRVAIKSRTGYKVDFGIKSIRSAAVTLQDSQGQPIALGSVATINDATTAPVGWDGVIYAKGLQKQNSLLVEKADGGSCHASFEMKEVSEQIANIGLWYASRTWEAGIMRRIVLILAALCGWAWSSLIWLSVVPRRAQEILGLLRRGMCTSRRGPLVGVVGCSAEGTWGLPEFVGYLRSWSPLAL